MEKGELSLDEQAHLVYCFVRDMRCPPERQRAVLTYIWERAYGIKGLHGGLLTEARKRLANEPFAPTNLKEVYFEALCTLYPDRDPHEHIRGAVRHAFGAGLHTQTVSAVLERVRAVRQRGGDDLAKRLRWADETVRHVQTFKAYEDASFGL